MRNAPVIAAMLAGAASPAGADDNLFVKLPRLTADSAVKVAQAAVAACRKEGVQITVTVMERGGHPQVVLLWVAVAILPDAAGLTCIKAKTPAMIYDSR